MDYKCRETFINSKINTNGNWGDDFHAYGLRWEPGKV